MMLKSFDVNKLNDILKNVSQFRDEAYGREWITSLKYLVGFGFGYMFTNQAQLILLGKLKYILILFIL